MGEAVDAKASAEARRVYGVLATGLDEALREVREALVGHVDLLPAGRLAEFDVLLDEFARRRVRVALYGEVKAGKSTLLNALAGAEVSPMAFDPMTSLPVRVTYGSETVWRVGDDSFASLPDVATMMRVGGFDVGEITVETPADLLRLGGQVDLLDTPGVGSDDRADQISAEALRALDAVVLVVRYPALFTRLTRQLMQDLESDIAKLFVVWNLDADCAELGDAERALHAEKLRQDVAGAHELALVDARAGLRARLAGDATGMAASGLDAFMATLAAFASSAKRELTALREAAKRADRWIDEAHGALRARNEALLEDLRKTRERLQKVASAAASEGQAARDQFDGFRHAVDAATSQYRRAAAQRAATLRRALRTASRRWARSGDVERLRDALREALHTYGESAQSDGKGLDAEIGQAARDFGAAFQAGPVEKPTLGVESVAPAERLERSTQGRALWLRRALFRRWYLPALSELEGAGIDADLASSERWAEAVAKRAEEEMSSVLAARLAESERRAGAEALRIKGETSFVAREAEQGALARSLPVLESHRGGISEINREARKLVDA